MARRRHCRKPRVRDPLGQSDIDVLTERSGDLILKKLSEAAMPRIHSPQQLAFVEPEGEGVIGLARSRFPRGLLTSEHDGEAIEVRDDGPIRLLEGEEPRLMRAADGR